MASFDFEGFLNGKTFSAARLAAIAKKLELIVPTRARKSELAGLLHNAATERTSPWLEALDLGELQALARVLRACSQGRTKAAYRDAILDALDEEPDAALAVPTWAREPKRSDLSYPRGGESDGWDFDVTVLPTRPGGLARETLFDIQSRLRSPDLRRCFIVSYSANAGLLERILTVGLDALSEACVHRSAGRFLVGPIVTVVLDAEHHGLANTPAGHRLVALARELVGAVEIRLGPTEQRMHAKVYAFEYDDDTSTNGLRFEALVGSSNLSGPGFGGQEHANIEANLRIIDATGFDQLPGQLLRAWLDELASITRLVSPEELLGLPADPVVRKEVAYKRHFDSRQEIVLKILAEELAARGRTAHPLYEVQALPSLLSHQWVPVVQSMSPTCRGFLLFDEVGLGKTIEAGLILSRELRRRREPAQGPQALIVAPAALHQQWQEELRVKFGMEAEVFVPAHRRPRPSDEDGDARDGWDAVEARIIIISPDHLRNEDEEELPSLEVVIVDECHRAQGPKTFEAVLSISTKARLAVFSSGTPIRNRFRELWYSASVALPEVMPPDEQDFERAFGKLTAEDIADLRGLLAGGVARAHRRALIAQGLVKERRLHDVPHRLDSAEVDAVHALRALRRKARGSRGDSAASSVFALEHVLMSSPQAFVNAATAVLRDQPDGFDPELEQDLHSSNAAFDVLRRSPRLARELGNIRDALSSAIRRPGAVVSKEASFLGVLSELANANVLVFTKYRRTQRRLHQILGAERGGRVKSINGSTGPTERGDAFRWFRTREAVAQGPSKVLVCTDVAAEGLNLQAASYHLVNYDLPWNPQRIEQRIGRLQRLGQTEEVHVYNLLGRVDGLRTIDEDVLDVCLRKFDLGRQVLGASERLFQLTEDEMHGLVFGGSAEDDERDDEKTDPAGRDASWLEEVTALVASEVTDEATRRGVEADARYRQRVEEFWNRCSLGTEDPALAAGHLHETLRAALLQGVVGMVRWSAGRGAPLTQVGVAVGVRVVIETEVTTEDQIQRLIEQEVPHVWYVDSSGAVADVREHLRREGLEVVSESEAEIVAGAEAVAFLRQLKRQLTDAEADAIPLAECLAVAPALVRNALAACEEYAKPLAEHEAASSARAWNDARAELRQKTERSIAKHQAANCKGAANDLRRQLNRQDASTVQLHTEILVTQVILVLS